MRGRLYEGRVPDANIEVLSLSYRAETINKSVYQVKLLCCGRTIPMTHRQITDKRKNMGDKCRSCANPRLGTGSKKTKREPDRKQQTEFFFWPKPPSIPLGYWLWATR